MIAKCALIALMAVVVSARSTCEVAALSSSRSGCQTHQISLVSSSSSGCSSTGASSTGCSSGPSSVTRNLIGKGKYPVALKNCGTTQQIPVTTSRYNHPVVQKPTVRLPARIPGPKVVSHSCTCYKTIVRPRVHQQIIRVPVIHRYIQTTHRPIVENIHYEAVPVNCNSGSSCGSAQLVEVGAGSSDYECTNVQAVQIPTVQVPRVCESSQVQSSDAQIGSCCS